MEAGKASRSAMGSGLLRAAHVREDQPEAGFGGADLFGAGRLRDRYLRGRPDLPRHAATVIAVATV